MSNVASLATRYAGRPLLLAPLAAEDLARRIRSVDHRAFERPTRLGAILRKLSGGGRQVEAMEDDDGPFVPPPPIEERLAYSPRWAGEPEDAGYCWTLKDGVALMCCDTPLVEHGSEFCGEVFHGYDTLLLGMRDAVADSRVKAIFLRMDCPGGVVGGGLAELSAFMRANRAAAGGKPIWVYADMACSAAYWISAQADRIVAPSVGYVASIGAVIVHESYSGALAEAGVVVTPIQFGAEKTDGAWWEALSERARASLQADVDQCGRLFVAEVALGRPQLTSEALIATQAAVYMAEHDDATRSGLALGFVDAIQGEEAAFGELVALVASSAPNPTVQPAPAVGSRADAMPQEAPMANQAQTKPTATAAEKATLEARLAEINAEEAAAAGPGEEGTEGDEEDEDEDKSAPAEAIAASAEAKAHPNLALAAIQSGQTLAQFRASVAAVAATPMASKLDRAMQGSRRLGPDATRKDETRSPFASAMAARAESNRKTNAPA